MGLLQCSVLPRILIVAMCCTLVSCKGLVEKYKRSNSGISALDKKVLYDFRSAMPTATPTIDNDTQRKVYSPIPPAGCPVAAGRTCAQDGDSLHSERLIHLCGRAGNCLPGNWPGLWMAEQSGRAGCGKGPG